MPFRCQTYAFGPRSRASVDNLVYVIVERYKARVAVTYNSPWKRVLEE
jgi:hypothetical protein